MTASTPAPPSSRPSVFLDRDGTIIEDPGYLRDPDLVTLFDGAGPAIARLNRAGLLVVVVTNQSGISRGLVTEAQYRSVAARVDRLLEPFGARIDASYFCPHAPEHDGPCPCRKPGLLLFERASADLGIDLEASWWVGDRISDVQPASVLGGSGILVETGEGPAHCDAAIAAGYRVEPGLAAAVDHILSQAGAGGR